MCDCKTSALSFFDQDKIFILPLIQANLISILLKYFMPLTERNSDRIGNIVVSNSSMLMEEEVSLPCSQQPVSRTCPEPDESSVRFKTVFNIIFLSVHTLFPYGTFSFLHYI
jgi:hypothetical protein